MEVSRFELEVEIWRWRVNGYIRRTDDRTLHAHFGICLMAMVVVWRFIRDRFQLLGLRGEHLLWALYFLRVYPTEDQGANFCGCTRTTFRHTIRLVIQILYDCIDTVG